MPAQVRVLLDVKFSAHLKSASLFTLPIFISIDLSSARRKMADIISVLASIYDTNDRFIEEFQAILADRLLQATDFNVDREV